MSHLLAIAVGPVQEFIAAARRTRDLWFGSYLLSEISKAVAKSVKDQGGKLIFPHPDTDLTSGDDKVNVANVILAELPSGEPREVAAKAKQAAHKRWLEFAREAHREASGVIRQDIWDDQVKDVIEFYAAWIAQGNSYGEDRKRLMRLLAGRKNFRDFLPATERAALPKSSLDGQRETVLRDGDRTDWLRALRLSSGEQLDVVGVVKRLGGGSKPYPSTTRVAVDPWVRGNASGLDPVIQECRQLGSTAVRPLPGEEFERFEAFPFDGAALFPSRHPQLAKEGGVDLEKFDTLRAKLKKLREPNPYLAVLVADGDKMGAAISALTSPDANRDFSNALAKFANSARSIVNSHNGVLVYAGGDDVLALLPVDKCLSCSRKLHEDFGTRLAQYGNPTLSVGIAIGHFMENLEDLLEYGRAAEKAAKQPDRDGLAVHLHKRGGAPIGVRARWIDNPDHRLERFANLMNDGIIPTKLPYELRTMANLYEPWTENADAAIQQDLYRLIARKASQDVCTVRRALSADLQAMNSDKLMTLASELLVARQIATAFRQASGQSTRAEEVHA